LTKLCIGPFLYLFYEKKGKKEGRHMLHIPYFVVMTLLYKDENFKMSDE
jgi:hypothetical protein